MTVVEEQKRLTAVGRFNISGVITSHDGLTRSSLSRACVHGSAGDTQLSIKVDGTPLNISLNLTERTCHGIDADGRDLGEIVVRDDSGGAVARLDSLTVPEFWCRIIATDRG